jgi:glycosyltransferase involved in cell wall biosynthesis
MAVNKEALRVAVLIDHRSNHPSEVGGLAGTWEQISRIVSGRSDLELTIFFLGESYRTLRVGNNVRHVFLRSILGTERFPFLRDIPSQTDLSPFHPFLFQRLKNFHLLQTTDTFYAFARTAHLKSRISHIPLVTAIQTDIIGWAKIYTPRIFRRIFPGRMAARWIFEKYHYLDRQQQSMERRLGRYIRGCCAVLISHDRDRRRVHRLAPSIPCFFLRRGIDIEAFHPSRRDRARLLRQFGVPLEKTLLLFVGRIDPVKGALVAARVVFGLLDRGWNVHLLLVGDGVERPEVVRILGNRATLTGNLPHEELGWIYASADLLLFPSEDEVWPNVVMESRACGLPVIACDRGARHLMKGEGKDGILISDRNEQVWLNQIERLLHHPDLLKKMGRTARRLVESHAPSWEEVFEKDLLSVWLSVAGRSPGDPE